MGVTERLVALDLPIPFEEGDVRREELVGQIIEANKVVTKFEAEIALIKSKMKPFVEERETALADLTRGIPKLVNCKETIYWEENRVETVRLDSLEKLNDRVINSNDHQHRSDDVDVE
jgi:hypothetical protein